MIREKMGGIVIVSVFVAGASLASILWTPTYNRARDDLSRTQAQVLSVQPEYAAYRGRNPERRVELPGPVPTPSHSQAGQIASPSRPSRPETGSEDSKIEIGHTQTFFEDNLFISVVAIPFEDNPLRNMVTAIIGSPGFPSEKMDRQDVGSVLKYRGKGMFEVRLVAVGTFAAEFRVARIQP